MTRILAILIVVSVIIATASFYSFSSEIRRSILDDRQAQLAAVEGSISERMNEITSIAYNVGKDPVFYFEPVDSDPTTGREMSKMLERYLVGNNFIEHLAYCRTSEPDTIYISTGERSLREFFTTSFGMSEEAAASLIQSIHDQAKTRVAVFGNGENAYFAYLYPLPQLAVKPKAHVLMLIPTKAVQPILSALLEDSSGLAAVFDADGNEIYRVGDLNDTLSLTEFVENGGGEENYTSPSGQKYVLQKVVSDSNGWTYVSVMRLSDTLAGLANRQLLFIALIVLVLVAAIIIMLAGIVAQYTPISELAAQVAEKKQDGDPHGGVLDERALLSDTIATLRGDSEQKQKYETAYYEAEAASKAKSAFLSSMSHDIRTPMNAIIGMTAIALKHTDDPAYVEDCLRKVQVSSDYLLDIINNVLDMSRIEAGRIPIVEEPMLIPMLIDSVVSLMSSGIEAKSQTLRVDAGGIRQTAVLGDSVHLTQVFVNILSNAVKFTPEGGTLTLCARQDECGDEGQGRYVFTFTDTGIGMPPEFVSHVFDTFTRADGAVASRTEGTGLGMAIAKKLVDLMGGDISCESALGRGTVFTVVMPLRLVDEETALSHIAGADRSHLGRSGLDEPSVDLTGRRILLVEDNAMNREIARRIITETGAEVEEAQDGQKAVAFFADHPAGYYDLIFMDIQMPVMNGYEATAAIRAMDRADAAVIPIYAMTANTFDEDVRQVKSAGMNGHIGKPYNPATVYGVLAQTLGENSE
jgi:signal transduction histidine kinase/ActR/RegA family two-component response regulator